MLKNDNADTITFNFFMLIINSILVYIALKKKSNP